MRNAIGSSLFLLVVAAGLSAHADVAAERTALWGGHPDEDCVYCKIQPFVDTDGNGLALMTYQHLRMTGMDAFYADFMTRSTDGGRTWSEPKEIELFAVNDANRDDRGFRIGKYVNPRYHRKSGTWFSTGTADLFYPDDYADASRRGKIYQTYQEGHPYAWPIYGTVDAENATITACKTLDFPIPYELAMPFGQGVELEDGSVLLPFYYRPIGNGAVSRIVVIRYAFANDTLTVAETGTPLENPADCGSRGICEPSIVRYNGKFYMTIRSDAKSYWATSDDGLTWTKPAEWHFTGGAALNTDSTQQHWAVVDGKLHLVYTRVHALAEGEAQVFRSRAPLYISRVDVANMLLGPQADERALVPNRGARLGNFCIAGVPNADENWLVVAEWMQNDTKGWKWTKTQDDFAKYGADNSIWFVRLRPETAEETAAHKAMEAIPAVGAEFYVATNGNDLAAGTLETPLLTIEKAKELADAAGGGTIYITDGTYAPQAQIATTTGKPVHYIGYSGSATNVVISGKNVSKQLFVNFSGGATDFTLRHVTLVECKTENGTQGGAAVNITKGYISNCIFRDNTGSKASVVYIDGPSVVENCLFYRNGGFGLKPSHAGSQLGIGNHKNYTNLGTPVALNCTFISDNGTRNIYVGVTSQTQPANAGTNKGLAINCLDIGDAVAGSNLDDSTHYFNCAGTYARPGASGWTKVVKEAVIDAQYRPTPASVVADSGSTELYERWASVPATESHDLDGAKRLMYSAVDIGAFECQTLANRVALEALEPEVGMLRWYSNGYDRATWDFGDGTKAVGRTVCHVYRASGDYVITVQATDTAYAVALSNSLPVQVIGKSMPAPWIAYRADDATVDANGKVTGWPNRSVTAGADLSTDSTALALGTYGGKPAVVFPGGTADFLSTASSLTLTPSDAGSSFFYVGRWDGPTGDSDMGNHTVFGMATQGVNERLVYFNLNGGITRQGGKTINTYNALAVIGNGGDNTFDSGALMDGKLSSEGELTSAVFFNQKIGLWKNGRAVSRASMPAISPMTHAFMIGKAGQNFMKPFIGVIPEVRVYSGPLTQQQRIAIECALASRYGMAVTNAAGGTFAFNGADYPDFDLDADVCGSTPNTWLASDAHSSYARSGALAVSLAGTPAANTNSFVYVAHKAAGGRKREWVIHGASGASTVGLELTFSTTGGFTVPAKPILMRHDGTDWVEVAKGTATGGAVRFSLPAGWPSGRYRLGSAAGLVLFVY